MQRTRLFTAVVAGAAVLAIAAQGFAKPETRPGGKPGNQAGSSRVKRGREIAPVPLDLTDKDAGKVWLGSYLVNAVGGCNDCHTNPSYIDNPFAGDPGVVNAANYLAGGRAFGPFVSANLTPDENGLPGGLTREQFVEVMRTGHEDDEEGLLQVMPWPVYRNMTGGDLNAIYDYLTAIPHAEPAAN